MICNRLASRIIPPGVWARCFDQLEPPNHLRQWPPLTILLTPVGGRATDRMFWGSRVPVPAWVEEPDRSCASGGLRATSRVRGLLPWRKALPLSGVGASSFRNEHWSAPKMPRKRDLLTRKDILKALDRLRSEEHTSELQSHSFISYAVF